MTQRIEDCALTGACETPALVDLDSSFFLREATAPSLATIFGPRPLPM
jgi:hypothetical protein